MKKYWKIQGQDGLWTLQTETPHHWWFTQGERGWLFSKVASPSDKARPASFEEIHSRPKPPTLGDSEARSEYEEKHGTWYVHKREGMWVTGTVRWRASFDTHAEAIAYAQKHAHKSGGEVSGA